MNIIRVLFITNLKCSECKEFVNDARYISPFHACFVQRNITIIIIDWSNDKNILRVMKFY